MLESKVGEEIAKCEVVCSNCHRVRTKAHKEYKKNPKGAMDYKVISNIASWLDKRLAV